MHPTLIAVLEGLKEGLLWTDGVGAVKYSNRLAEEQCGLKTGHRLPDGRLKQVVQLVAAGKAGQPIELDFEPVGGKSLLHAKVMPAMISGDAFVFFSLPPLHGEALALKNLLTVISTDLNPPLKRVTRALESAQEAQDPEAVAEALTQMRLVVDTMTHLVDLSEVWQSESLLATDRLQVWDLLQDAWKGGIAFAESKHITVRLVSAVDAEHSPVLYGSEYWMRRVMTESLQAALRAAAAGATLDIELRQMGPRLLIVFRNSGLWPARASDATVLNDGNAPKKPGAHAAQRPALNAKDMLGLHLCQRIVALHGGQLREEDDDGIRNFLIDLPTGAPFRNGDETAMDAAQAQRYAADLSALMARRRKPTA